MVLALRAHYVNDYKKDVLNGHTRRAVIGAMRPTGLRRPRLVEEPSARQNSLDWCSTPYRAAKAHNVADCKLVFNPNVVTDYCTDIELDRRVASEEVPECCQPVRRQHDERLVVLHAQGSRR